MLPARITAFLTFAISLLAATLPVAAEDIPNLEEQINARLKAYGEPVQASMWIGLNGQPALFQFQATTSRPTASSIKTFYLVELFAKYHDQLDKSLPQIGRIVNDDTHPAVSHFSPQERKVIQTELGTASIRRVGKLMMGSEPASNHVYNAAANVTTALLGGPRALTKVIHEREPAFATVEVNRYMLRDRIEHGDNVATAAALAALYLKLSSDTWTGIDHTTHSAIVDAVKQVESPRFGLGKFKGGHLGSDPLTHVLAGWWKTTKGPLVYVIMLEAPCRDLVKQPVEAKRLRAMCEELRDSLTEAIARQQNLIE